MARSTDKTSARSTKSLEKIAETMAAEPRRKGFADGLIVKPSLRRLEPRLMFDGAAPMTVEAMADEAQPAADAAQANTASSDASGDDMTAATAIDASAMAQVYFIDAAVESPDVLMRAAGENADVVVLSSDADGLAQIAAYLEGRNDITALHIVAHGAPGELRLGDSTLSQASIEGEHADALARIAGTLHDDADLMIYGCNFGAGDQGLAAMQALADATGADLAASNDDTGHADLGGDWDLEVTVGSGLEAVSTQALVATEFAGLLTETAPANSFATLLNGGTVTVDGVDVTASTTGTVNSFGGDGQLDAGAHINPGFGNSTSSLTLNFSAPVTQFTTTFEAQQDEEQITFDQPATSIVNNFNSTYGVATPILSQATLENGGLQLRSNLTAPTNANSSQSFGSNSEVTWVFATPVTSLTITHTGVDSPLTTQPLVAENTNYNGTIIGGAFTLTAQPANAAPVLDLDDVSGLTPVPGQGTFTPLTFTTSGSTGLNGQTEVDDGAGEFARYDNVGTINGQQIDFVATVVRFVTDPNELSSAAPADAADNPIFNVNGPVGDTDNANVLLGNNGTGSDNRATVEVRWQAVLSGTDTPITGDFAVVLSDLDQSAGNINNFEEIVVDTSSLDGFIIGETSGGASSPTGSDLQVLDAQGNVIFEADDDPTTFNETGLIRFNPIDSDPDTPGVRPDNSVQLNFTNTSSFTVIYNRQAAGGNLAMDGNFTSPFFGSPVSVDTNPDFANIFTEGEAPVAISSDRIRVTDDGQIASATITLTNPEAADQINVPGSLPTAITVQSSSANQIVLTGLASPDDYETAINAITFENTSFEPNDTAVREIDVTVTDDSGLTSNIGTAFMQVIDVPTDTDGDGITDDQDVDDDNDGILDVLENELVQFSVIDPIPVGTYSGDPDGLRVSDASGRFSVDIFVNVAAGSVAGQHVVFDTNTGRIGNGSETVNDGEAVILTYSTANSPTPWKLQDLTINDINSLSPFGFGVRDSYAFDQPGAWTTIGSPAGAVYEVDYAAPNGVGQIVTADPDGTELEPIDFVNELIPLSPGQTLSQVLNNPQGGSNGHNVAFRFDDPTTSANLIVFDANHNQGGAMLWNFFPQFEARVIADSDGDGLSDQADIDSDNDGITDNIEAQATDAYIAPSGVGNSITDANNDGLDDVYDTRTVTTSTAAAAAADARIAPVNTDAAGTVGVTYADDTTPDYLDTDSDGDGLTDNAENGLGQAAIANGTLSNATNDADGDGLFDQYENNGGNNDGFVVNEQRATGAISFPDADSDASATSATPLIADVDFRDAVAAPDTDGDSITDDIDIDDDNDGILDVNEGFSETTINFLQNESFEVNNGITGGIGSGVFNGNVDFWDLVWGTADFYDGSTDLNEIIGGGVQTFNATDGQYYAGFHSGDGSTGTLFNPETSLSNSAGNREVIIQTLQNPLEAGVAYTLELDVANYNWGIGPGQDLSTGIEFYTIDAGSDGDADGDGVGDYNDRDFVDANNLYADGTVIGDLATGNPGINFEGRITGIGDAANGFSTVSITFTPTNDVDRILLTPDSGRLQYMLVDNLRLTGSQTTIATRDTDGDGIADHLDIDSDNDGITDNIEAQATDAYVAPSGVGGTPDFTDVDGDGLDDEYDQDTGVATTTAATSVGLTPVNSDGDADADYLDTDSDNEGSNDTAEAGLTGTATGLSTAANDADGDGLFDVFDTQNSTTNNDGFVVNEGLVGGAIAYPDIDNDASATSATPLIADVDFRDAQDDSNTSPIVDLNGPNLPGEDFADIFVEDTPGQPLSNLLSFDAIVQDAEDNIARVDIAVTLPQPNDGADEFLRIDSGNLQLSVNLGTGLVSAPNGLTFGGTAFAVTYSADVISIENVTGSGDPIDSDDLQGFMR
ncbi:MAG: DUF4347 domain-containing protein, partial [Pseudomonadota bacterium]